MNIAGGGFVLHTFMAEKNRVEVGICVSNLPSSNDFRGQGGDLISANYSRLKNEGGGRLFQGKKVYQPTYVDEGSYF
jgi:hypothetical protein